MPNGTNLMHMRESCGSGGHPGQDVCTLPEKHLDVWKNIWMFSSSWSLELTVHEGHIYKNRTEDRDLLLLMDRTWAMAKRRCLVNSCGPRIQNLISLLFPGNNIQRVQREIEREREREREGFLPTPPPNRHGLSSMAIPPSMWQWQPTSRKAPEPQCSAADRPWRASFSDFQ